MPSWQRSKQRVSTASRSLSRRFSAATVIATRLKTTAAPITSAHLACGTWMPKPKSAAMSATDWPTTASQRSTMSVRSRTQSLGALRARSGRVGSDMAAG